MKFRIPVLMAALAVCLSAAAAFAKDHDRNMVAYLQHKLDLTSSQTAQVQTIVESHQQKEKAFHAAMEARLQSVLTPEQRARLEQMKAHHDQPRTKSEDHGTVQKPKETWTQKLGLTPLQSDEMKAFFKQQEPQMKADMQQFKAQVELVLNADQKARFEALMQKHEHHGPSKKSS